MKALEIFCQFQTAHCGKCLMYCPDKSGVCKNHRGKVSKKKIASGKFRGASRYAKENGMFKGVKEH